ncbi:MAG: DUF2867 domain-containing protein, partial [Propionibacteriaceae bacterium]|nr:DUF2867 domain-containing protein [Propionibacteriaceae bacterium]
MKKRLLLGLAVAAAVGGWWWARQRRPVGRAVWRDEPVMTDLLASHAGQVDYVDAWAASISEGESDDPAVWAGAVISFPGWVGWLMRARDGLARLAGLAASSDGDRPDTGFPVLGEGDHELVLGLDDQHLDFRVGVTTGGGRVVFTTTVVLHNDLGHLYWAVTR